MEIHFIRHATFLLHVGGVTLLIDPMLSPKHSMDPVANCKNQERIPMVDLPISETTLKKRLQEIDAVIVTHTHRDHWDVKAQELLNKKLPLICQPSDSEKLNEQGFSNLMSVNTETVFKGLKIFRTGGQHGTGEIGIKMGHVSGFILEFKTQKIYIAGDTIWCTEVEYALATYKPQYIVLNTGAAQFDEGDPITMTENDIIKVRDAAPTATIIAVHMETVNHCRLRRDELKKILEEKDLMNNCLIPMDGEKIIL